MVYNVSEKKDFLFCKRMFWFFTCLESSHGFLSMIFGFLGKFGIGIGDPKMFERNFFVEKNPKTFWSKIFGPKFFSTKMFSDFFRRKMFSQKTFRSPIPTPNFPKIPKIMLRKPCDDYKQTKTSKNHLSYVFSPNLRRRGYPPGEILCSTP